MTGFKRIERSEPQDDGHKRLLCTEPGCGRRWVVQMDAPKCSKHQWPRPSAPFDSLASSTVLPRHDSKTWARRILALHEAGGNVRPVSLQMARSALRIGTVLEAA